MLSSLSLLTAASSSRPAMTLQDARFHNTPSPTPPAFTTLQQRVQSPAPSEDNQHHSYREYQRNRRDHDLWRVNPLLAPKVLTSNGPSTYPDGRINLTQRYGDDLDWSHLPPLHQAIKRLFPAMVLPNQAPDDVKDATKMKVTIPPSLRLNEADYTVLYKLEEIQRLFDINLIPYSRWAARLANEMSGDFLKVKLWAVSRYEMPWILMVEGVLQVLAEHQVLFSPVAQSTTIPPFKEEAYHNTTRSL